MDHTDRIRFYCTRQALEFVAEIFEAEDDEIPIPRMNAYQNAFNIISNLLKSVDVEDD